MTTEEHDKLMRMNAPYRDLFMRYLGCLGAMTDAAVHLGGNEEAQQFDVAFDDAEKNYPHIRVKRILDGREIIIVR